MSLKELISKEIKDALKAKDSLKVSTLRFVLSNIKNREIELQHELSDSEVIQVLDTLIKQHYDSIEQFKKASRDDLVSKEEAELGIIRAFMPPPLSESEIKEMIKDVISKTGAEGIKDLGKVMKELMPRIKGRADGKRVREMVDGLLSS